MQDCTEERIRDSDQVFRRAAIASPVRFSPWFRGNSLAACLITLVRCPGSTFISASLAMAFASGMQTGRVAARAPFTSGSRQSSRAVPRAIMKVCWSPKHVCVDGMHCSPCSCQWAALPDLLLVKCEGHTPAASARVMPAVFCPLTACACPPLDSCRTCSCTRQQLLSMIALLAPWWCLHANTVHPYITCCCCSRRRRLLLLLRLRQHLALVTSAA